VLRANVMNIWAFKIWSIPFIAVLFALTGCKTPTEPLVSETKVGMSTLSYEDDSRLSWDKSGPRPLITSVWYPSQTADEMELISFPAANPVFVAGFAAQNAEIETGQRYPLVVLSHGTGGSSLQMMWLGRELAKSGYIVISIDHHGNTAAEARYDPRGFRMPWHRAMDVSAVLDKFIVDEKWGPLVDQSRISMVGFSLGGYTAISLAGGITDLAHWEDFCASPIRDATCDPQPEYPTADAEFRALLSQTPELVEDLDRSSDLFLDERIGKYILLAPAVVQLFSQESLSQIETEMLVIVGHSDDIAPSATNAEVLAQTAKDTEIQFLQDADHYSFLNTCTEFGRSNVPVCKERQTSRSDLHALTISAILNFL